MIAGQVVKLSPAGGTQATNYAAGLAAIRFAMKGNLPVQPSGIVPRTYPTGESIGPTCIVETIQPAYFAEALFGD